MNFKGTPGTKIRWTIRYRIEREYCQERLGSPQGPHISLYSCGKLTMGIRPNESRPEL
jgi:hypothetical protein